MRLLLPSVIAAVYCFLSLVLPLKAGFVLKALMGAAFLAAGLKYVFYQVVGGGFFRPELPIPVMLAAEALYAALLVLFFLALVKDAANLGLWLARRMGASWRMPLTGGIRCTILVVLALASGAWGTWQAVRVPDVHTVELELEKLPAELEGFTLVQLSDLHIGPVQKAAWLEEVVRRVNALSPDAVAITGDIADGLPRALSREMAPLAELRAKYGVFGVTGNHEYYYDARGWLQELSSLGVIMLNNEHRVLRHRRRSRQYRGPFRRPRNGCGCGVFRRTGGAAHSSGPQAQRQRPSLLRCRRAAFRPYPRRTHLLPRSAHRLLQRRIRPRSVLHAAGQSALRQPGHGPVERLFLPPRRTFGNHPLRAEGKTVSRNFPLLRPFLSKAPLQHSVQNRLCIVLHRARGLSLFRRSFAAENAAGRRIPAAPSSASQRHDRAGRAKKSIRSVLPSDSLFHVRPARMENRVFSDFFGNSLLQKEGPALLHQGLSAAGERQTRRIFFSFRNNAVSCMPAVPRISVAGKHASRDRQVRFVRQPLAFRKKHKNGVRAKRELRFPPEGTKTAPPLSAARIRYPYWQCRAALRAHARWYAACLWSGTGARRRALPQ